MFYGYEKSRQNNMKLEDIILYCTLFTDKVKEAKWVIKCISSFIGYEEYIAA